MLSCLPVTSFGLWSMIWFCPVRLEGTVLMVGEEKVFWKSIFVASLTNKYKREAALSLMAECCCVGLSCTEHYSRLAARRRPEDTA